MKINKIIYKILMKFLNEFKKYKIIQIEINFKNQIQKNKY